jgi:hypothetical protein
MYYELSDNQPDPAFNKIDQAKGILVVAGP